MAVDTKSYRGQKDLNTDQGEWNQLRFIIQQQMMSLQTSLPVEVVAVRNTGLNPVGQVDIRILVDIITGNDETVSHGIIPNVPYFRLQGGANAVIIDPEVGDIGMANFSSRDISAVKNARKQAPPGSRRAYDFSDAMYSGGFLNGTPTQFIQFTAGGIIIHSPTKITQNAPELEFNADTISFNCTDINMNGGAGGEIDITGVLKNNGVLVGSTHRHSGSPTAPNGPVSNTGQPI